MNNFNHYNRRIFNIKYLRCSLVYEEIRSTTLIKFFSFCSKIKYFIVKYENPVFFPKKSQKVEK